MQGAGAEVGEQQVDRPSIASPFGVCSPGTFAASVTRVTVPFGVIRKTAPPAPLRVAGVADVDGAGLGVDDDVVEELRRRRERGRRGE